MTKHSKILALFLAFSFVLVLSGIAQEQAEKTVVCPVCCKEIKESEVKATYEHEGKTHYFCSEKCKEMFMKDPEKYTHKKVEMKEVYTCPMHPKVMSDKPGKCPECGMKLEKKMMYKKKMMHKEKMHHKEKMYAHMEKKCEKKACCPMMDVMSYEDVEMNVENIKDGIAVKITSKNAEVVKKIQEKVAKMKAMCEKKKEVKKEEVKK